MTLPALRMTPNYRMTLLATGTTLPATGTTLPATGMILSATGMTQSAAEMTLPDAGMILLSTGITLSVRYKINSAGCRDISTSLTNIYIYICVYIYLFCQPQICLFQLQGHLRQLNDSSASHRNNSAS